MQNIRSPPLIGRYLTSSSCGNGVSRNNSFLNPCDCPGVGIVKSIVSSSGYRNLYKHKLDKGTCPTKNCYQSSSNATIYKRQTSRIFSFGVFNHGKVTQIIVLVGANSNYDFILLLAQTGLFSPSNSRPDSPRVSPSTVSPDAVLSYNFEVVFQIKNINIEK